MSSNGCDYSAAAFCKVRDLSGEELEAKLPLHDLAAVSSKEQYALASMRLQGCSIAETACIQGMSEKRVRGLLRELYRVYMCLYT